MDAAGLLDDAWSFYANDVQEGGCFVGQPGDWAECAENNGLGLQKQSPIQQGCQ